MLIISDSDGDTAASTGVRRLFLFDVASGTYVENKEARRGDLNVYED